jgi:hypothetical protein
LALTAYRTDALGYIGHGAAGVDADGARLTPEEGVAPPLVAAPSHRPPTAGLPGGDRAQISPAKFVRYSMDPAAQSGSKWKAWGALGYDVVNGREDAAADVERQLRAALPSAETSGRQTTRHGTRVSTRTLVRGPNGRRGTLVSVWQYDGDSSEPRMITNWLEVHKTSGVQER